MPGGSWEGLHYSRDGMAALHKSTAARRRLSRLLGLAPRCLKAVSDSVAQPPSKQRPSS